MIEYIDCIKDTRLFQDLTKQEIIQACLYLDAKILYFKKNEIVIDYYQRIKEAYLIFEGETKAVLINEKGNEYSLSIHSRKDLLAASYALLNKESLVQFKCLENSKMLSLKLSKLLDSNNQLSNKLLSNLASIIAMNNISQNIRMQVLSQKSIRDKLIVYLHSIKTNSKTIYINLNRQELANYLNVDRSALSRELGNLKRDGYIDYNRHKIIIIKNEIFDI